MCTTECIYKLNCDTVNCLLTKSTASMETWHRRLGHINYNDLNKMKNGIVDGISFKENTDAIGSCEICSKGKQSRLPFKNVGKREDELLNLIHSDL